MRTNPLDENALVPLATTSDGFCFTARWLLQAEVSMTPDHWVEIGERNSETAKQPRNEYPQIVKKPTLGSGQVVKSDGYTRHISPGVVSCFIVSL